MVRRAHHERELAHYEWEQAHHERRPVATNGDKSLFFMLPLVVTLGANRVGCEYRDRCGQGYEMTLAKRVFFMVAALYWLLGVHFFMHNPGGDGLYLPFNMLGWVFASVLIGAGLWHAITIQRLVFSRAQLWLWGGLSVACLPFLAHPEVSIDAGAPRMLGIAGGLLLLFSLSQLQLSRQQRYRLLYLLLAGVAIEALFGLVQYFLLTPGNWIGYNTSLNRPYGIFQQVNVFASFIGTGVGLAAFMAWRDPELSSRNWRGWLVYLVLFTGVLLELIVRSRAGLIGCFVVLAVFLPLIWKQRRELFASVLLVVVAGILVELTIIHFIGGGRSVDEMVNSRLRLIYWAHSLDMIASAPWFGIGYGNFEAGFVNDYYAIPQAISGVPIIEQNLSHPHNEILYWLVEGGLVGVAGLVLMGIGWWCMLRRHPLTLRLALFILPFPLLFHAMVEYPFYHSTAHWLALIWLLWLADAEAEAQTVVPLQNWLLLRTLAVLIPLLTVPYMLTGLQTAYWVTQFERGGLNDPSILKRVLNPLPWYSRFMYDVSTSRLVKGLAEQDGALQRAELSAYVSWASNFVKLSPRSNVYFNGAIALDTLGQHAEAEQWRQTGARLFPASTFFKRVPAASPTTSQATGVSLAHQKK